MRASLNDVLQDSDKDTISFITATRHLLAKKGIMYVVRVVGALLGKHRQAQFQLAHNVVEHAVQEMHEPTEADPFGYIASPSAVAGKRLAELDSQDMGLDHNTLWKKVKTDKDYLMTSEPYYIQKEELKALIAHCDEHGVDFQIDAESMYYPGHAIRILFKKDHISSHDACAHQYIASTNKTQ